MNSTLNQQIALVKFHSLQEFKQRLKDGKLKKKAQYELLFLRDTSKFRYYVSIFQLDEEIERKMIQQNRTDLFRIYFSFHSCYNSVKLFLVHFPKALSVYACFHSLPEKAQMIMVKEKKQQPTLKYIQKRPLCDTARAYFRTHAHKSMVNRYEQIYGCC